MTTITQPWIRLASHPQSFLITRLHYDYCGDDDDEADDDDDDDNDDDDGNDDDDKVAAFLVSGLMSPVPLITTPHTDYPADDDDAHSWLLSREICKQSARLSNEHCTMIVSWHWTVW